MNKKPIILIEDNIDDELLTIRALKKNNIENQVIVLRDGQEALNWFMGKGDFKDRNINDTPAFVLLDLQLPKIDGLNILDQIKSNELTKKTPVIILTTSAEINDIENSYKLHANSYIRKPVDFNEFFKSIKVIADYWINLNKLI